MPDNEKCADSKCSRDARMAISTNRSARTREVTSTFYYDNRQAPKKATRYCKTHGMQLAASLVNTLTDMDEDTVKDGA